MFYDKVAEYLEDNDVFGKGTYRKPSDQTCRPPLTRNLIKELITVCQSGTSRYTWLSGFMPIGWKHGDQSRVDDGTIQMQISMGDFLDSFCCEWRS